MCGIGFDFRDEGGKLHTVQRMVLYSGVAPILDLFLRFYRGLCTQSAVAEASRSGSRSLQCLKW